MIVDEHRAGALSVRVRPGGPGRLLLLHGGPGLTSGYLDSLVAEIDGGWTVALPQQRGHRPSTTEGPFDIDTAVDDLVAVLDHLGWDEAVVVGHSYGGLLGLFVAARHPARCTGLLLVDSIGTVGDGGNAAFVEELLRRTPEDARARLAELDGLPPTPDSLDEELRLVWQAYFADPPSAPPYLPVAQSPDAFAGLMADLSVQMPVLAAALPSVRVPLGALVGSGSPIPRSASADVVARVPGAWLVEVPGAGHFPWLERPGCVDDALARFADPPRLEP